eukprot:3948699-Pleurochrysis_carterae.AAC.1
MSSRRERSGSVSGHHGTIAPCPRVATARSVERVPHQCLACLKQAPVRFARMHNCRFQVFPRSLLLGTPTHRHVLPSR